MPDARILLVDDDLSVLSILVQALKQSGYEVLEATNGATGARLVQSERPDLVVLDVLMPGLDGLTACEQIRAFSDVPILMLTALNAKADFVEGLDRGADDYMTKPFGVAEFMARVRAMLRRTPPVHDHVLSYADLRLNLRNRKAYRGDRELALSQGEFELLSTFVQAAERALSRDELSRRVWGYEAARVSNFVEVAVGRLRRKVQLPDERPLIRPVRGFGYVLSED
jgi:two-component system response regulator MprA